MIHGHDNVLIQFKANPLFPASGKEFRLISSLCTAAAAKQRGYYVIVGYISSEFLQFGETAIKGEKRDSVMRFMTFKPKFSFSILNMEKI